LVLCEQTFCEYSAINLYYEVYRLWRAVDTWTERSGGFTDSLQRHTSAGVDITRYEAAHVYGMMEGRRVIGVEIMIC
jgi:hypothetical protein